jgi:hypothetical protein
MKLFITNREKFSDEFPEIPKNKFSKKGSQIHKEAFSVLSIEIANNHIPIVLITDYDGDGLVLFDFKKKVEDVYFYEFTGTAK